jgi:hypothetical protein
MSRFWKRFLREGQGFFARGTRPQVWLGAFGKHPGWDDHIDDIGLETDSLLLAKQILYVEGIGGQISSGEWEKLDSAERLGTFKHLFLWKRGDAFLIGRISSSRDGKNRTQYPLVLCAHCLSIPFAWALTNVSKSLESIETQCKSTQLADEVRAAVGQSLTELRNKVAHLTRESSSGGLDDGGFKERFELARDLDAVHRTAEAIQTRLAGYLAGSSWKMGNRLAARQIRLPAAGGFAMETLGFWSRFFDAELRRGVSVLLVLPLDESWVDVTCGEPTPRDLYSLRATRQIVKVASEAAEEIPSEFRSASNHLVEAIGSSLNSKARFDRKAC